MKPQSMHKTGVVALALALSVCCSGAAAALFEDDEARRAILDLRQRMEASQTAQKAQAQDSAQLRRLVIEQQSQIDALVAEVSKSKGTQEQLARDLAEAQMRQRDAQSLQKGIDERLRRFEPLTVQVDGREFAADPQEKRDYDAALETLRKGDFAVAQAALQRLLQRFPQTGYAPSALFWMGNAAYVNKDYKEALAHLRQMLVLAPTHLRAPDAMLAVANVHTELKDSKAARKALEDLLKAHPQSDAAQTAKERLAKLR